MPPRRINEIVHGKRRISADTALRLGRYFATDPQFWINLLYGLEPAVHIPPDYIYYELNN